mgnify:FL=1
MYYYGIYVSDSFKFIVYLSFIYFRDETSAATTSAEDLVIDGEGEGVVVAASSVADEAGPSQAG